MQRVFGFLLVNLLCLGAAVAGPASVVDGDTLDIGDVRYRIHGVDAPERGQRCAGAPAPWRCGRAATAHLAALVENLDVECRPLGDDGRGRIIAKCFAGGRDLGAAMVESGHAWAFTKYSDDYRAEEARAREARRGVWLAPTEPAWDYRANRWRSAAQTAPEGCAIKGNISASGRIYHPPWSRHYERTRINLERGERWFCSEEEARAAGWRAPRQR